MAYKNAVLDNPEAAIGLLENEISKLDWDMCYPAFNDAGICVAVISANGVYPDADVLAGFCGDVQYDEVRDGYYPVAD